MFGQLLLGVSPDAVNAARQSGVFADPLILPDWGWVDEEFYGAWTVHTLEDAEWSAHAYTGSWVSEAPTQSAWSNHATTPAGWTEEEVMPISHTRKHS